MSATNNSGFNGSVSNLNTTTCFEKDGCMSFWNVAVAIAFTVLLSLLIVFGLTGNFLVIHVVRKMLSMRSTTNVLLASLAAADVCSLVFLIPALSRFYPVHPEGTLGDYICVFVTGGNVTIVSLAVSILTLALLAFERHQALAKPLNNYLRVIEDNIVLVIACIWAISLLFTLPHFIYTVQEGRTCVLKMDHKNKVTYLSFVFFFLFLLPYSVIIYCYMSIIKGMYFSKTICPELSATGTNTAQEKRKIVKLLLSVTLTFTICVGTFVVINALNELNLNNGTTHIIGVMFLFANCCANSIIYAFQSSNYRNAFREVLQNRCMRDKT